MREITKVVIGVAIVGLLVIGFLAWYLPKFNDELQGIPVNGPPSANNTRPVDLTTGKHLDEEGFPASQVDWQGNKT